MLQRKGKQSTSDIPIGTTRKNLAIGKRKLEHCEPGVTREEVLGFIEKVVTSPKPYQKRVESPAPASK